MSDNTDVTTMPEDESIDEVDGHASESTLGTPSRRRFLSVAAATGAAATLGGTAVAQQSSATVTFDDQTTGGKTVTVAATTLPEGGYVAIHDDRLNEGKALESVVGVSAYLEAGTHEDVEVTLFDDVEGADFDMEMLEEDQSLVAMPHRETNGNETYEFVASGGESDGPYTKDGGAVVDSAAITVEDMPTASVTFEDQTTGGTTVDIASTTLSEGGFVAIHDSSLLDGDVLESVVGVSPYLEAGTHEDVTTTLFNVKGAEYDTMALEEDQTLIAMPHLDTNDNDVYDFVASGGNADGPYTAEGNAVVDDAAVTVEADEMPTAEVCFPDQTSDGMTVSVPEATLSEGGFVTIHDSSLQDGDVFDSVVGVTDSLDAGTHTDLEVDLFEGVPGGDFEQTMLKEDTTLIAMPHFDSNDNGSYDFITSEGQDDGPYTMDGKPVVNPGEITVEDGC
jgi:hypothetical protein